MQKAESMVSKKWKILVVRKSPCIRWLQDLRRRRGRRNIERKKRDDNRSRFSIQEKQASESTRWGKGWYIYNRKRSFWSLRGKKKVRPAVPSCLHIGPVSHLGANMHCNIGTIMG